MTKEYQQHAGAVTSGSAYVGYAYSEMVGGNHDRLTSMTYPNGRVVTYNYGSVSGGANAANNTVSRLTKITDGSSAITLEGYDYLGWGTAIPRTHGNGVDQSTLKLAGESTGDAGYTDLADFVAFRLRSGTMI